MSGDFPDDLADFLNKYEDFSLFLVKTVDSKGGNESGKARGGGGGAIP